MKYLLIFIVFLLFLIITRVSISPYSTNSNSDFRVGLRSLPSRVDPRTNEVNIYHYINTHLYFPLFELTQKGEISSIFLDLTKTKSLDKHYRNYLLCLNNLNFSDGSQVKIQHLKSTIIFIHQKNLELVKIRSVTEEGSCLRVELNSTDPRYFYKLTTIDSTILKEEPSSNIQVPIGLGPYMVSSFNENKISLVRAQDTSTKIKGITNVTFLKILTPEDGIKYKIHDWNHLWQHLGDGAPIPVEVKLSWKKFNQNLLRSLMLVIHLKDDQLRKKFVFCFDQKDYSKSLGLTTVPTSGYLPLGLIGNNVSFDLIKSNWHYENKDCFKKNLVKKEIPLYLFYPNLKPMIERFLQKNNFKLPINIKVKIVDTKTAVDKLFSNEELIITSLADTMNISPTGFFTPFIGKKKVILQDIPSLDNLIREASQSATQSESETLFSKAHFNLLNSAVIIPLGQINTSFYYPKFIKVIPSVDPANGFPQINKMEVY